MLKEQLPTHREVMVRRSVTFGFYNPLSVWSDEVWSVFDGKDCRACAVRQILLLGSHLKVYAWILELIHEHILMCFVGKT